MTKKTLSILSALSIVLASLLGGIALLVEGLSDFRFLIFAILLTISLIFLNLAFNIFKNSYDI